MPRIFWTEPVFWLKVVLVAALFLPPLLSLVKPEISIETFTFIIFQHFDTQ